MLFIAFINFTDVPLYYILNVKQLQAAVKPFHLPKGKVIMSVFRAIYHCLWGVLFTIPLPGGSSLGISLLVLILIPSGIYFTIRTRFLPFRLFPEMLRITAEKRNQSKEGAISGMQALIVSTATRVGMGNLVGVVAAISLGGAGAVFWM